MFAKQKETIVELLKTAETHRNYEKSYWFSYEDFFDPTDRFTVFSCENLEGKKGYIAVIQNLLNADETAKIFVEVYGSEEDGEPFIYADTLIIFSRLPIEEIEKIFHEPKDIFPDDIGRLADFSRQNFIILDNGDLLSIENLFGREYSVYYCWWD